MVDEKDVSGLPQTVIFLNGARAVEELLSLMVVFMTPVRFLHTVGSAVAWWLMPRTPDPEVGGSRPTRVKPCCVLEQGTFTPQKVLVIPRKRWLRPNMTEKLFTGTIRINQPPFIPWLCPSVTRAILDKM